MIQLDRFEHVIKNADELLEVEKIIQTNNFCQTVLTVLCYFLVLGLILEFYTLHI
jgi:hypothetical protein